MGAYKRIAKISTEYLAEKLDISQQTASRYLIELERGNWIHRTITPRRQPHKTRRQRRYRTTKTLQQLESFDGKKLSTIHHFGGHRFLRAWRRRLLHFKDYYKKQFIEKLGLNHTQEP